MSTIKVVVIVVLTVCMKRSTSPFASAHPGVTSLCLNPCSLAYFANLDPLNGGPLSVFTSSRDSIRSENKCELGNNSFCGGTCDKFYDRTP